MWTSHSHSIVLKILQSKLDDKKPRNKSILKQIITQLIENVSQSKSVTIADASPYK